MDHPLLGALVRLAGGEGLLFTGRLSLDTHPWLADHAVSGTVLLPGTAFVELALRAGGEAGCGRIEELTLPAPLLLAEGDAVQMQLSVGEPDETGRRQVRIYTHTQPRSARGAGGEEGAVWTMHASGVLCAPEGLAASEGPAAWGDAGAPWPTAGADAVPLDGLYERLAELGYDYGPAFRGLRAAWRRGEELFAEIELPQGVAEQGGSFELHPALLDGALHAVVAGLLGDREGGERGEGRVLLPFSWSGVDLHATGASRLRVRLTPAGDDEVSLSIADEHGAPVAHVRSLALRPVAARALEDAARGTGQEALFRVDWQQLASPAAGPGAAAEVAFVEGELEADAADGVVGRAHEVAQRTLELMQAWLADRATAERAWRW